MSNPVGKNDYTVITQDQVITGVYGIDYEDNGDEVNMILNTLHGSKRIIRLSKEDDDIPGIKQLMRNHFKHRYFTIDLSDILYFEQ